MQTRGIVKTSGFTRVFVKIGDFIKFKGFSCGILREQAILRKSKAPRKSPEKSTFLSLAFTMHLVCTLLINIDLISAPTVLLIRVHLACIRSRPNTPRSVDFTSIF